VQSVAEHRAHLAPHGTIDKIFDKVRETFIQNLPTCTWDRVTKPTIKTLRDKLRCLMRDRRSVNNINERASGIDEEISSVDELLDDLIHEKDEAERKKKPRRTKRMRER